MSDLFHPNAVGEADIDGLEDWQLIVAACHFGPQMGDCRTLDYGYHKKKVGAFWENPCEAIFMDDVDLTGDIDEDKPAESLERYAGLNWRAWCREAVRRGIRKLGGVDEQEEKEAQLTACRDALFEIAVVCVTPERPYDEGAFPQLENAADARCLADAICILRKAIAGEKEGTHE